MGKSRQEYSELEFCPISFPWARSNRMALKKYKLHSAWYRELCQCTLHLPISASYKPLSQAFLLGSLSIGIHMERARRNAILGENGTQSTKSFRKWPLLWDCFVFSWQGLPELEASWGCLDLWKDRDGKCCLILLSFPHNLQNLFLTWLYCCDLSLLDSPYSCNFSVRKCSSL